MKPLTASQECACTSRPTGVVDVAAACIHNKGNYLIARRKPRRGGFWEFVGGKREVGETLGQALKREVREELGVEISVRPAFYITTTRVNGRRYRLHFCRARILRGQPKAIEHSEIRWVRLEDLAKFAFPPANRRALKYLLQIGRR